MFLLWKGRRTLHCPTYSGGVWRTPADSCRLLQHSNPGLCWCDMGQICCFSPAGLLPESARLHGLCRTLTGLSPADSGRLLQDSGRLWQTLADSLAGVEKRLALMAD